jgi:uncharacterized protein
MSARVTEKEKLNREAVSTMLSGKRVHLFDPQPEEIDVRDMARGLSRIPRYVGQTTKPYWVADHSVLVARIFMKQDNLYLAKQGLFHDGAEYIFHDIPHPLKYMPEMLPYKKLEKNGQRVVYRAFGLDEDEAPEVKTLDTLLVNNEKRDLRPHLPIPKDAEFYPDLVITPCGSEKAEREFLKVYNELFGDEFGEVEIP